MKFLFALAERFKVRDEQFAKLVLDLARHEGRHRAGLLACPSFSGGGGGQGREFVGRFSVGSSSTGRRGWRRREVERSEVFGKSDSERGDERERFLVRRELFASLAGGQLLLGTKQMRCQD